MAFGIARGHELALECELALEFLENDRGFCLHVGNDWDVWFD